MSEYTKGPWEYRHVPAGEEGIYAKLEVREGKEAVCRIFEVPQKPLFQSMNLRDGIIEIEVAYSAWYQFECCDFNKDQWKANAQLIAAAPDMLDMLERLNRSFDVAVEHDDPIMKRLDLHHKRIKETIAKATGQ